MAALLALAALGLAGCVDDSDSSSMADDSGKEETDGFSAAADQSTCRADATELSTPYGDAFPTAWVFPAETTAFNVEERGVTGTIVTAVSSLPFRDILDFLNHDEVAAGFAITEGETEEHDAEANWTSDGYRGRWAIRESAECPGETVIQVLAAPAS